MNNGRDEKNRNNGRDNDHAEAAGAGKIGQASAAQIIDKGKETLAEVKEKPGARGWRLKGRRGLIGRLFIRFFAEITAKPSVHAPYPLAQRLISTFRKANWYALYYYTAGALVRAAALGDNVPLRALAMISTKFAIGPTMNKA